MERSQAKEMIQWARGDFERHRNERDIVRSMKSEYTPLLTSVFQNRKQSDL
jgi:hypothetical protein